MEVKFAGVPSAGIWTKTGFSGSEHWPTGGPYVLFLIRLKFSHTAQVPSANRPCRSSVRAVCAHADAALRLRAFSSRSLLQVHDPGLPSRSAR